MSALLERALPEVEAQGKILLVTGRRTREIAGVYVERFLRERGHHVRVSEALKADMETVSKIEAEASRCSLAIAVGGGTIIDSCKYVSHNVGIPFISIPTTISHDGIASPVASIWIGSRRVSLMATPPKAVLIVEHLVRESPKRLLASGCADILAKSTSLRDWLLGREVKGEYFCEKTFDLTASALSDIKSFLNGSGKDVYLLSSAAIKCGIAMSLVNSSRPCSGAEHLFSHYLDVMKEGFGLHGEQVGLGAILMATRYEELNMHPQREYELRGSEIKDLLARAGAPTSLSEVGVAREIAVKALLECKKLRPERYTILHHAPLTPNGALKILEASGVLLSK